MQFIIKARDGENMLENRMRVRPRHLENMAKVRETGRVLCAGGLLDEKGQMAGSVLIMDFPSRADLDNYLANEPYVTEKVWAEITVEPMNVVILNDEKVGK